MNVSQLIVVTRYEFLLQWRQRVTLAIGVMLCLLAGTLVLIWHDDRHNILDPVIIVEQSQTDSVTHIVTMLASDVAPDQVETLRWKYSTEVLTSIEFLVHPLLILVFPILFADTLPKDQQYGVRDLLQTLPMTNSVYIACKLLASVLSVALSIFIPWILTGIAWWAFVYPFHLISYVTMYLTGLFPAAVLATLSGILVAAGQRTRRRAVLMAAAFAISCTLLLLFHQYKPPITLVDHLNPARPVILHYYMVSTTFGGLSHLSEEPTTLGHVGLSVLAGIIEVAAIWTWVQWRMRRQQAKA